MGSIFTCILPIAIKAPAAGLHESAGVKTSLQNNGSV